MPGRSATAAVQLDPALQYLRITRGRAVGYMWRGSTERNANGEIEVYYSSAGEILRLQNGRIVAMLGLTTEWRHVLEPRFSWSSTAATGPTALERTRDVMPGYRSGIRDELTLRRIEPPGRSALSGIAPSRLMWFEEQQRPAGGTRLLSIGEHKDSRLPPARYAVQLGESRETVVYSEQCLATDVCFTWQRWSSAMQQPGGPAATTPVN